MQLLVENKSEFDLQYHLQNIAQNLSDESKRAQFIYYIGSLAKIFEDLDPNTLLTVQKICLDIYCDDSLKYLHESVNRCLSYLTRNQKIGYNQRLDQLVEKFFKKLEFYEPNDAESYVLINYKLLNYYLKKKQKQITKFFPFILEHINNHDPENISLISSKIIESLDLDYSTRFK